MSPSEEMNYIIGCAIIRTDQPFPGNVTSKMATSAAVAESGEAVLKHPTGSQYKGPLKNGR